jgi:uncharacterized membrane protein YphA (DoxX/SURF4 family)
MKATLVLLIRLGLGILFLYGGIEKVRHPFDFLTAVYGYQLVGPGVGLTIAGLLPWLEIVTGVSLICGLLLPGASGVAVLLCLVISVATTSALVRGLKISCGCFGGAGSTIDTAVVLRALSLLGAATVLLLLVRSQTGLNRAGPIFLSPADGSSGISLPGGQGTQRRTRDGGIAGTDFGGRG